MGSLSVCFFRGCLHDFEGVEMLGVWDRGYVRREIEGARLG